ncbi:hypothetical protein BV898_19509 [Hypsibius exemplaris]|uniref:Cupin type-1 domain-containing protein n=1 Tax=Hypsibius exemplaris TaxID=2072580 RepID=A0A9X6NJ68_HYPEX|nr:hypothetical protein BV898_19509 [Hypsibius exemplaris]
MMIHSALFFFVVLAVACADVPFTGTVRNHIPADAPPAEISMAFKNAIPNDPGRSVVGVLVTYPAGGATPSHRHAPSAFITVTNFVIFLEDYTVVGHAQQVPISNHDSSLTHEYHT